MKDHCCGKLEQGFLILPNLVVKIGGAEEK